MKRVNPQRQRATEALDDLIEEITCDAFGDHEQLCAFEQALMDHGGLPASASVIGEPVTVVAFEFKGVLRGGLIARCRRDDGSTYEVSAADLVMPPDSQGERYIAAYRKWMGLPPKAPAATRRRKTVEPAQLAELVVLAVKQNGVRCPLLGTDQLITLRASRLDGLYPGEIVTITPRRRWTRAGQSYVSGSIASTRLDAAALDLVPLKLHNAGEWDPAEHYWGDDGPPEETWAKAMIAWGPRPEFEMEQVLPGENSNDPCSDPIVEANDRRAAGDTAGAYGILMNVCQADLRCLDAHAHLGIYAFNRRPLDAIRHYEVGVRIGELSLGDSFLGVLSWGWIDNRPFLRCMVGYGLCLWRLGRFQEAQRVFERMLG